MTAAAPVDPDLTPDNGSVMIDDDAGLEGPGRTGLAKSGFSVFLLVEPDLSSGAKSDLECRFVLSVLSEPRSAWEDSVLTKSDFLLCSAVLEIWSSGVLERMSNWVLVMLPR